jgi:hypothetical protein
MTAGKELSKCNTFLIDLREIDANSRLRRDQSFDEDFVAELRNMKLMASHPGARPMIRSWQER